MPEFRIGVISFQELWKPKLAVVTQYIERKLEWDPQVPMNLPSKRLIESRS
jgi:hypothetical protein